jgi:phenylalanyl-tRNA synthetase alpha chain
MEKKHVLTQEGRKYLEHGLPEVNLANRLSKPMPMAEAQKLEGFSIALLWAKKNGWVKIESGSLVLVKKPGKPELSEALEKIERGEGVAAGMLDVLVKRRLVELEREDAAKKAGALAGKEVAGLTPELIKTGLWKDVKLKHYNIQATGEKIYPGKRHPYNRFLDQVRKKLVELGFKEMTGPMIETEFWNFDALYQPQDHPSRDWTQTYSLKNPKAGSLPNPQIVSKVRQTHENGWTTGSTGWGYRWNPLKAAKLMPRAHGTAISARMLASSPEIPGKYFAIVRCFRPDVIDATHGVEFNQTEGIVIDQSMNFRHLLGLLKQFALEFADAEEVRFNTDYYPFTEPSVQLSAKHPKLGWIEFAGAGIFRPEFTLPLGIKEPVLAWGLGVDRLAMFKLGINDIRDLFTRNLGMLRKQKVL